MKLKSQNDINASVGDVFAKMSDADRWEAMSRTRGMKVSRIPNEPMRQDTEWLVKGPYRGKVREFSIRLQSIVPDDKLVFISVSSGMEFTVTVMTTALSATETRLSVELVAKPRTIAARFILQSAKLARGRLLTQFRKRMSDIANGISDDLVA